ncbi:uncharacterized protein [Ptychodera flava]|uniref:uncharacterized protein n=1 Tax=Ptychodera flava TaxID=63121 RepID=UPI003969D97D
MADDLTYEIYWTKDSSDDEDDLTLVHVPGVNDMGNKRPSVKMRARRTREIKAKVPPKSPVIVEDLSPGKRRPLKSINKDRDNKASDESQQENSMKSKERPALKDLRPEDKKRVANLIRELARIGEEKENAEEQLESERHTFEDKIAKLKQQYNTILSEREDLQQQYMECQKMLTSYQTQLASQQEKMSQTLSELVATPLKNAPMETASFHLPEASDARLPCPTERLNNSTTVNSNGHQAADPQTNGMYSMDSRSRFHPQETGLMRFQQEFRDNFKPEFASTNRSHLDTERRNHNYTDLPRLEERDLLSERSEPIDRFSIDNYNHMEYRDSYIPAPASQRNSKKYDGLTPPDTYESRTAGGEFRPLTPVDSEQGSEYNGENVKLSQGSVYSDSHGYARNGLKRDEYRPIDSANYRSLPLDSQRTNLESHRTSLPAYPSSAYPAPTVPFHTTPDSVGIDPGRLHDAHYVPAPLPPSNSEGERTAPRLLSPELRKQQLLIQREQLRLEQIRLKHKLKDQETQLSRKQEELKQQRELHEDRLRYFELHGKFPPYFSPYTPQSPTYKKKYSPKSDEDQDNLYQAISTNYPPFDTEDNTPLRRLDLDDEHVVNSINAKDSSYRSLDGNNSYRELNIGEHTSSSRHYDLYGKQELAHTPSVLNNGGSTSLDRRDDYVSPSRHNGFNGDTASLANDHTKTPNYDLDKRHTVDIGTSPLYADRSSNTSPYRSSSQKMLQPDTKYTTESLRNPLERYEDPGSLLSPKQQYNLPSEINRQRTSPPRNTETIVNGYGSSLTAIVDSMERTSIHSPMYDHHRPLVAKTPELFGTNSFGENDNAEHENNLIEEVFFLK